ncbi:PepSY domain-containing protein [Pseudomonas fuscovaginae UPB0736]|uniref:Peptidase propeptide and YPEB domain-containing protein n=1 Tax=Pseudomonas asplenii TaxID=53407 RepID=A0A1H6NKS9_9PSED|nr:MULTISPECIES: PepSY domain-containing protein [Pseudomonas]UUQ65776.1 PepSY domain-containing protein [Pseudomonas fuscovaginae UPB0736]UZE30996.1 PepSY domain-containing protein [Pseudomonas asplenii]SDT37820.1 Peptidase propeptide and YPEB domain-containing protein [Pseudomonas asplenii]SEI16330.1 Peptidase propeptide and YPEB domain-containing protein [Pseudomonas fuscovaginae]
MKALGIALVFFTLWTATSEVSGRDIAADEAAKLQAAGTILSLDRLATIALARHPGASPDETGLERRYGHYIYRIELRDAQGIEWEIELDASSGQVLKDHQDR